MPKLILNLDNMFDEYYYTSYDIAGSGHSIVVGVEDKEQFLDEFTEIWRERAERLLEECEDEED